MATWNTDFNNSPANGDSPGAGDDKIRETRLEIYTRMIKGHIWGGSSTADGWHREGSGIAYYQSTEPTLRPDAATALDSNDDGRLWVNSDGNVEYVWDGDSWEAIQTVPNNIAIYQDQKTQNTNGGTATSGAYRTRDLNTEVVNNISGVSLASNQVTLPAGDYYVEFSCPAYYCDGHVARFYDTTSSASRAAGYTAYSTQYCQAICYGVGDFTLLSESVLELQHYVNTTRATDGFGKAANITTEVYSQVMIMKVG